MKIAYLLKWNIYNNDGVTKKVKHQIDAWREMGHAVEVFCIMDNNWTQDNNITILQCHEFISSVGFMPNIISSPYSFIQSINTYKPDVLYMRYTLYKPYYKKLMEMYPTFVEINSNDLSEFSILAKKEPKFRFIQIYNKLTRNRLLSKVNGMICVTNELSNELIYTKYRKPQLVSPNGINLSDYPILKNNNNENKIPNLFFISSPNQPWQGIDKIIQLAKISEDKIFFHIVGSEAISTNLPNNIKFYGYLQRSEYEKIVAKCDIGIGTLALYRKKMDEACPLKVREYIAYGLPVIIGYHDTAFLADRLPEWILQLENSENNIQDGFKSIIEFCKRYMSYTVKHQLSHRYFDIKSIERKKMAFISSQLNRQ